MLVPFSQTSQCIHSSVEVLLVLQTDTWKFHFTLQLVIIQHKLSPFSTAVSVEFDPRSYAVNESSGSVSVCVRVNGQLARNVVVRVQTGDISATGS